jgi:hypothetical protein
MLILFGIFTILHINILGFELGRPGPKLRPWHHKFYYGSPPSLEDLPKLIATLIESQMKTDEQLRKTDEQLKNLIGYNKNRDYELESIMEDLVYDTLDKMDKQPIIVKVSHIPDINGTALVQFDGVIAVDSYDGSKFLLLLETKQRFKVNHVKSLKERALLFQAILPTLDTTLKEADEEYKMVARRLYRYRDYKVAAIACSPNFDASARKLVEDENIPFVTLSRDVYKVTFGNLFLTDHLQ